MTKEQALAKAIVHFRDFVLEDAGPDDSQEILHNLTKFLPEHRGAGSVSYTCPTCWRDCDLHYYPATYGTRETPPEPAEFEPGECPYCGVEWDQGTIL
jgi:DNA-directed RNA polymerase subunit RPC12/RpoP